jgi:hypothetical protein
MEVPGASLAGASLECADLAALEPAGPGPRGDRTNDLYPVDQRMSGRGVCDCEQKLRGDSTRVRPRWSQRCQVSALQRGSLASRSGSPFPGQPPERQPFANIFRPFGAGSLA